MSDIILELNEEDLDNVTGGGGVPLNTIKGPAIYFPVSLKQEQYKCPFCCSFNATITQDVFDCQSCYTKVRNYVSYYTIQSQETGQNEAPYEFN